MANEMQKAAEVDALIKKDADEKEAKAKADAAMGENLDKMLCALDNISKRMDAWEEADKARKDAEEAAEKEKGDPKEVVADADGGGANPDQPMEGAPMNDSVKLDSVRKIYVDSFGDPAPHSKDRDTASAYRDSGLAIQYEANRTFSALGSSAPTMVDGTTLRDYETHLLGQLVKHSKKWNAVKSSDLARMDAVTFKNVKAEIYADAWADATDKNRGSGEGEELREYTTTDAAGRRIVNFAGESRMWLKHFAGNRQRLIGIRNGNNN